MSNEKDWSIPDAGGIIYVPDRLQNIFNNIGMQIRLHTISEKNEVITVAHITQHADSFARSQAIELGKWIHEDDCDFYYDNIVWAWRSLGDDKLYSDDEIYTAFLLWQEKQQEGKEE